MKNQKDIKQKIIKAGVELIRSGEELSARNLAKQMGCSTQPIYSAFKNMMEIEKSVRAEIQKIQDQRIVDLEAKNLFAYQSFGLGLVSFAREEKEFFAFLYLNKVSNVFDDFTKKFLEKGAEEFSKMFVEGEDVAFKFYLDMLVYSYGLAVMQHLGQNVSDKIILNRLAFQFEALKKMYNLKQK